MIRIAFTIGTLLIGGAEVFVVNLIKSLDPSIFQVILIVLDKKNNTYLEEELETNKIEVIYLNKPPGMSIRTMFRVRRILKKFKPTLIHGNIGGIIYVLLYLLLKRKAKAIQTCHTLASEEFNKFKRRILKYFYLRKRIIPVVISKTNYQDFLLTYKINRKYLRLITNGIEIEKFYNQRLFNQQEIRLGHVGRFEDVKNHKMICDIYLELKNKNKNVVLRLVGSGSLLNFYKDKMAGLNVIFVGETARVAEELKKIDIFVFPSIYEGLPLAIIEAMASGCVIVASDVGGLNDLIIDGVNGYKFKSDDLAGFVNCILKLINKPDKMKEISNNNLKKAKEFSIQKMKEEYESLYLMEANEC